VTGRVFGAVFLAALASIGCSTLVPSPSPNPTATFAELQSATFAEVQTAALPGDVSGRLSAVLDKALGERNNTGLTAAVVTGGGSWTDTVGHDLAGEALAADAQWNTGSIAKTVVAAQILRLAEQGRLELDKAAADYISMRPLPETNGASIRDLLRMRSGLGSGSPPGTAYNYANGDYVLLGQVIEGVEQKSLGAVLTSDILAVPGAEGLVFPAGGTVENAAGPLMTDAHSLARWGYELYGGRLLAPGSLAAMLNFDENTYGMGTFDFSADFHQLAIGHLGTDPPWSAALVVLPNRETSLAVLSNSSDWEWTYDVTSLLADAFDADH
jgi:D-alanyl-D-alanine carboxypeptidase